MDMILSKEESWTEDSLIAQFPGECQGWLHICCHPETIPWALDHIDRIPQAYGAFGVHPHDAHLYNDQVHQSLCDTMAHPKTKAWGEIGLDYFYDQSPRDIQRRVLATQLEAAQSFAKPIVLHTRSADADTLSVLKQHLDPKTKMHVHCFTGEAEFATQLMDLSENIWFGFTGIITFKNADNVRRSLEIVPEKRLLVETDGPFLAPVPFRGKTAHPGMIPQIIAKMAEVKGLEIPHLWRILRQNTKNVYDF